MSCSGPRRPTGTLTNAITGSAYGFNDPDGISSDASSVYTCTSAISSDDTHVWTAQYSADGSIDELFAAIATQMGEFGGTGEAINYPTAIAANGTDAWIAATANVVELSEATGELVRSVPNVASGYYQDSGSFALGGASVWTIDGTNAVCRIAASTGSVHVVRGVGFGSSTHPRLP